MKTYYNLMVSLSIRTLTSLVWFVCLLSCTTDSKLAEFEQYGIRAPTTDKKVVILINSNGCNSCIEKVLEWSHKHRYTEQIAVVFVSSSKKMVQAKYSLFPLDNHTHVIRNNLFELRNGALNPYIYLEQQSIGYSSEFEISPSDIDRQLIVITSFITE